MPNFSLDTLAYQTRLVAHLKVRDTAKKLAIAMVIMITCWAFADPVQAQIWSGLIVFSQLLSWLFSRMIVRETGDLSALACTIAWAVTFLSTIPLLAPAYFLAATGSEPLLLVACLWLFGTVVHVSTNFAALPFYNWSLMGIVITAACIVMVAAYQSPHVPAHPLEWIAVLGAGVVYFANTFETTINQKDIASQLDIARRDADRRLSELEFLNQHDHLTGLMNRRAFEDAATALLPRRRNREKGHLGYFLLDLDGFKPINDSYSHKAGDAVLVGVADRLRRRVGGHGLVARLGGDEFAVAVPGLRDTRAALKFGKQLAEAVKAPLIVDQKALSVGTSVGIALSSSHLDTLPMLASGADQAMYQAKRDPGRNVAVYDKDVFPARATLNDRDLILRAMKARQIAPYYQPKICLNTGRITGFEALARWNRMGEDLVMPGNFIPMINELGLQGDFLMHTTQIVLEQVTLLLKEGLDPGDVSVNVPEVTLATISGRAAVMDLIRRFPMALSRLTFEVTEDVFINRSGQLIQESIAQFRRAGVRISLDDFGTGFASFNHLRELEFDELKLDTSFVRDLGRDPAADVLVQGFLDIGQGLGVTVIAEGIENADQLERLRKMGCKRGQGFYFCKAVRFSEARAHLREEARRKAGGSAA